MAPIRIFISYAHEDKTWFQKDSKYTLIPYLVEALRREDVVFWYDKEGLMPSDEFKRRITEEIDNAQIALLIISQSFLASEFIEQVELPRIRARAERGEMIAVPVLVAPCAWDENDFLSTRQMLPGKPTPLIDYTENERDMAHVRYEILDGLKKVIRRLRNQVRSSPPPPSSLILSGNSLKAGTTGRGRRTILIFSSVIVASILLLAGYFAFRHVSYAETISGLNLKMIWVDGNAQTGGGYWMGATEVTNGQYKAFLNDSGYDGSDDADLDYMKHLKINIIFAPSRDDHPMVFVSWKNAKAFCDWLSKKTGKAYCLPKEAQWEHACRAGSIEDYYFGNDTSQLGTYEWYNQNSEQKFHAVAQKKANQWELYDMHGNVREWCEDLCEVSAAFRILRGGSFLSSTVNCRVSERGRELPESAYPFNGFRVCRAGSPRKEAQEAEQSARSEDQSSWAQANAGNSLESYRKYLAAHGDGQFKNEASQAVTTLEASQRIPFGVQIAAAKEGIARRNWESVEKALAAAAALFPQDSTLAQVRQDYKKANPVDSYDEPICGLNLKMIRIDGNTQTGGGYWIGATEVTNGQYKAFLKDSGYNGFGEVDTDYMKHIKSSIAFVSASDEYPIVFVSWKNAKAFCDWLAKKTGKAYCLPKEAQWEHACRAGSIGDYCFGGDTSQLGTYAWYSENSDKKTHPVAQKKANQWKLYDMHGNVWEWCEDISDAGAAWRVARGGSGLSRAVNCRASNHVRGTILYSYDYVGFRVCRVGSPR